MSGAAMIDMFRIQEGIANLPPWLRLKLFQSTAKYCQKCGRLGKKEAHGYGATAFSCEGGKTGHHERLEWEVQL